MGIALLLLGLGLFCVLVYYAAIYALPFAIGLQAMLWAISTGAGAVGGIVVGIVVGAMVFAIGQFALASSRSVVVRWIVVLLFAIPAAIAGYSTVTQFSDFGLVPSPAWRQVFGVIGALIISGTAIARLSAPLPEPRAAQGPVLLKRPQPTGLQKSMLMPE